jgi:YqaJ-like viral recombinase domain
MARSKPAAKAAPQPLIEIFDDIEQGSDEWFQIRLGVPTASNFGIMMRDGDAKTRAKLMRVMAGEILTGRAGEGKIVTAAMQRGKDMEEEARQHYLDTHFAELRRVGFIRRKLPSGRYVGCSPDALIGTKKALEIKTMAPDLMIERLERGAGLPPEHRPQVQGTMWVADLASVDLMLFYSGMPFAPKFTVFRDETYIAEIARAVEVFDYETRMLVEKIRKMG